MAENFDLIFGSSASQSYSWNDSDYQNGWQTVGDTPPTREQFDALQRRADLKAQELNNRLAPIEENDTHDYRQPSTAYTAGQIKYHPSLPTGWYLECTTAGDTDAGALVITSPSVGGTVTDGTVVWTVRQVMSTNGGVLTGSFLTRAIDNNYLVMCGGTWRNGAFLQMYGKDYATTANKGMFQLTALDGDTESTLIGRPDDTLTWIGNDLAGSAIVAKSLGTNGYVKYASGLIIQWGMRQEATAGPVSVTLPIAVSTAITSVQVTAVTTDPTNRSFSIVTSGKTGFVAYRTTTTSFYWFAVGY